MEKGGQMQISFGFIVGIIIIAATIGVAFFVINHFLIIQKCAEVGFFFEDLEREVDKAWASSIYQDTFTGDLPGSIDWVCFGNLTLGAGNFANEYSQLRDNFHPIDYDNNVYLLPTEKACDGDLSKIKMNNAEFDEFFCVDANKVNIRIEKGSFDAKAKVGRA